MPDTKYVIRAGQPGAYVYWCGRAGEWNAIKVMGYVFNDKERAEFVVGANKTYDDYGKTAEVVPLTMGKDPTQ